MTARERAADALSRSCLCGEEDCEAEARTNVAEAIRAAEAAAYERAAKGVENATVGAWGWSRPTVAADIRALAKRDR